MPVIQVSLSRLEKYCKNLADAGKILETLPYLGLDIEDQVGDTISVEYSPNRPDFSSESGIARSLTGLLGIEVGLPKYTFTPSKYSIKVTGHEITQVRPQILGIYAEIAVTEDIIKQLINVQEDLHNGVGRRRSKVAIGIHNAEVLTPPIKYYAENDSNYSFVPLGGREKKSIREILSDTEQGVAYGRLLSKSYPMLVDSARNVLSMPPIINGELTRLKPGITRLFVDITGTEERAVDASTAIIAAMLSDMKAKVQTVTVESGTKKFSSPDMTARETKFDLALVNDTLGFEFSLEEATRAITRSRLEIDPSGVAKIPRFRYDIIHPIDLAEEVALGFGIAKIKPVGTKSSLVGTFNPRLKRQDRVIDVLVGLGLTEIWNLSLTSLEDASLSCNSPLLKVDDPKSQSFEYLRSELMTSLLANLGASTHQEYPQRIFEQATVFRPDSSAVAGLREDEHVAVAIADSGANYSMIHSVMDGFFRLATRVEKAITLSPVHEKKGAFAVGRSAIICAKDTSIGMVGEISPEILERYGIKVPVVGFEINIETLLKE
ncbi:MAG: phenylalanine--tRNA ligase subunit beta [Thaumarchaeota archaeon]|nr:phenylalanine--tRNA ligase subunit beta [Nitrososphaerota archaeon]